MVLLGVNDITERVVEVCCEPVQLAHERGGNVFEGLVDESQVCTFDFVRDRQGLCHGVPAVGNGPRNDFFQDCFGAEKGLEAVFLVCYALAAEVVQ